MDDYLTRMIEEESQLHERYDKLTTFVGSPAFDGLEPLQRRLLCEQRAFMDGYLRVLRERINNERR
jgi:hypothetical protein